MEDWFAKAAKEEVDSWYLHNRCTCVSERRRVCVACFSYNLKASLFKHSWSLIASRACFLNEALTQCRTSYTWCSFGLEERSIVGQPLLWYREAEALTSKV